MELTERRVGNVVVIIFSGTLTSSDVPALHDAMAALLARGVPRAIFDLDELTYLDSLGLGELVACQLRATRAGMMLRLANPDARLQDLLLITRLITVFDAYSSLSAALASFDESQP